MTRHQLKPPSYRSKKMPLKLIAALFFFSILLMSYTPDLYAQVTWAKTYGGLGNEVPNKVLRLSDGYIIGGVTQSSFGLDQDIWITRVDNIGNIIWQKKYGGSNTEYFGDMYNPSGEDKILIVGTSMSFGDSAGDFLIFEIDLSGNVNWATTYGEFDKPDYAEKIIPAPSLSGGIPTYIIGGQSNPQYPLGNYNVVLLNLRGDDQSLRWIKSYDNSSNNDYFKSIDNYVVAANTGGGNVWVFEIDENTGSILWQKKYGPSTPGSRQYSVHNIERAYGDYILSGTSRASEDPIADFWTLCIAGSAPTNIVWDKALNTSPRQNSIFPTIKLTGEGKEYTLCGQSQNPSGNSYHPSDSWLLELTYDTDTSNLSITDQKSFNNVMPASIPCDFINAQGRAIVNQTYSPSRGSDFLFLKLDYSNELLGCPTGFFGEKALSFIGGLPAITVADTSTIPTDPPAGFIRTFLTNSQLIPSDTLGNTNAVCTGIVPPIISAEFNNSGNFGNVPVGSSVHTGLAIINSGESSLTVDSINFTGGNAAMFSLSPGSDTPTCPTTLPFDIAGGGDSCWYTATFTPTSSGNFTTTLQIASNDPANPVYTATGIQGNGILPNFTISGMVTYSGSPLAGVQLSGFPVNTSTPADGTYSATVPAGWGGTVSPVLAGYKFNPPSMVYSNVSSDWVNQDYIAARALNAPTGVTINTSSPPVVLEWQSDVDGNGIDDAEEIELGLKPPGWVNYRVYYGTSSPPGLFLDVGDARIFQLNEINPTPGTYYLAVAAYLAAEPWNESPPSDPVVYNLSATDSDGDGIPDAEDNCPSFSNDDQSDTDWDGQGDACDACPLDPDNDADSDGFCANLDDCPSIPGTGSACHGNPSAEATTSQGSGQDTDGDGKPDISDNCPSLANADQTDSDGDGIGDSCDPFPNDAQNDRDGDGIGGDTDNCPFNHNPKVAQWTDKDGNIYTASQPDFDLDGTGDACDIDMDADGIGDKRCAVAGQDPCLQYTAIPISSGGDNCPKAYNPSQNIDACQDQDVIFTFNGSAPYDAWLPTDGASFTISVDVPSGTLNSLTVSRATNYPGKFTNDADNSTTADYGCGSTTSPCALGMTVGNGSTIYSLDYGGSITLRAEATVEGQPVVREFTIPRDTDGDGLPDAWEGLYGDLHAEDDIDATRGNQFPGDKLTARQEYRGFFFGLLDYNSPAEANGYKTAAFIPRGTAEFFRGNPRRKELFIKYTGYSTTYPFAIGSALFEAGIDAYALPSTATFGTSNLRVMSITHNTGKLGTENGHINKVANYVRYWTWDTKGVSAIGTANGYGSPITYKLALDYYFSDKTYYDKTPGASGKLDPLNYVEDKNDNGKFDIGETNLVNNTTLDGDRYSRSTSSFSYNLSPFDIDKDGKVELPMAYDPNNINTAFEYTKKQVLKHTITHEIGHALGVPETHTQEADCVMFKWSNNWSRDGKFGDAAKGYLRVFNLGIQ